MGKVKVKVKKTRKKILEKRRRERAEERIRERWRSGMVADGGGRDVKKEVVRETAELEVGEVEDAVKMAMKADKKLHEGENEGVVGKEGEPVGTGTRKRKKGKVDSNWEALKAELGAGTGKKRVRKMKVEGDSEKVGAEGQGQLPRGGTKNAPVEVDKMTMGKPTKALALDCEMVGVGPNGARSILARVAIVNSKLELVYHAWVKPVEKVTDYRTEFSGVRAEDLASNKAVSFKEAQRAVSDLLNKRILVGHAISNDLEVLLLGHPRHKIRDTSRNQLVRQALGLKTKKGALGLKRLTAEILGEEIQKGEHNPFVDARATMRLYLKFEKEWEASLAAKRSSKSTKKSSAGKDPSGKSAPSKPKVGYSRRGRVDPKLAATASFLLSKA